MRKTFFCEKFERAPTHLYSGPDSAPTLKSCAKKCSSVCHSCGEFWGEAGLRKLLPINHGVLGPPRRRRQQDQQSCCRPRARLSLRDGVILRLAWPTHGRHIHWPDEDAAQAGESLQRRLHCTVSSCRNNSPAALRPPFMLIGSRAPALVLSQVHFLSGAALMVPFSQRATSRR